MIDADDAGRSSKDRLFGVCIATVSHVFPEIFDKS